MDELTRSSATPSLLVVTDSHVGATFAGDVGTAADVCLATDRDDVASRTPDGVRTAVGEVTTVETLAVGADATAAVVALRRDRQALLVTQLLRTRFDIDDVVVLLNDPERHELVAELATTVVCGSSCLSAELGEAVARALPEPTESHS